MKTPTPVPRAAIFSARAHWIRSVVLGGAMVLAISFLLMFALPHLAPDERRAALYASRRPWLLRHIFSGTAITAFYLALHTPFGFVFGMGLTGLGVAWIVTTAGRERTT